ncbi:MAG: hypothetical protein QME51_11290, partial [Planctomycetota bacterium]|nr:hypothetical protein [Planctomycetota bacterium]
MTTVRVRDQYANYVPSVAVSITTTNDVLMNGVLTQNSNAAGLATFDNLSISIASTGYALSATSTSVPPVTSNLFDITPALTNKLLWVSPPASVQTAGSNWTVFTIEITDQSNNRILTDNTTVVTLVRVSGTDSFASGYTATAVSGLATFSVATYNIAETITIKGTAPALVDTTTTGSITINPSAVTTVTVSGPDPITSDVESPSYTAVSKDVNNNIVSDTYTWTNANGSGTATRNVDKLTGVLVGTVTITATSNVNPTISSGKTVTVLPGAITTVTVSGDNTVTSAGTPKTYTATSKDANGNIVSETYTWTHINDTGSVTRTDSTLTGFLAGTATITATGSTSVISGGKSVTILPGTLTTLSFIQQPTTATVGATITPAITVKVQDDNGNLVPAISISITTTDGTLMNGTLTQNSDSSGIATFNDLSIPADGNYSLLASCILYPVSCTSVAFTILPTLPSAPISLTAVALSPTAITLTWTDTSNNE